MHNIAIQEHAFSDLAIAIFVRACSDYRGHVDRSEGDPKVIQQDAKNFLDGATEDWHEAKKFWLRIAGIDEEFFNEYLLPKLLSPGISESQIEQILRKETE